MPLNDGSYYPIIQKQIDEWNELYLSVDVLAELKKMRAWLDANKCRRKTKKGIMRFIVNWLSRAQDKPHQKQEESSKSEYPNL